MGDFVWIPGYPGYQIAVGPVRIRRVATGQLKKFHMDQYGYRVVNLGYKQKERVHRLVATVFIPNPDSKPQVNHIDGNKLNNEPNNLEWATCKENIQHAFRTGLRVRKLPNEDICVIQHSQLSADEVAAKYSISKGYAQVILRKGIIIGEDGELQSVKTGKGKPVINTETGEIYRSGAVLAKFLGIRRRYLTRKLNGQRNNNTPYRYLEDCPPV